MTDWGPLGVDYCQYRVRTVPGVTDLEIYCLGDDLLHVGGPDGLTGFSGTHTGQIQARVRVLPAPPPPDDEPAGGGWDAISEATLWSPSGQLSVVSIMGGTEEDSLLDVAVPRGLIRVRVHARNRLHESVRTDGDPPEQHELHVWAVAEETPWRTVLADPNGRGWAQRPERAVEWAMLSLVPRRAYRPHPSLRPWPVDPYTDDSGLDRVTVVRHLRGPVEVPVGVLPVGDLEVRLERVDDETFTWSWATAAEPIFPDPLTTLPDDEPSIVRLTSGPDGVTLRHEGVLGRQAFALGLIWEHLLDSAGGNPWLPALRAQAAKATERAAQAAARAERERRLRAEREAEEWGGAVPSERVRVLISQADSLARIDRPLLDRLEALPADRQRETACWAARRAARAAGLEQVEWAVEALADAEAGRPPAPLPTEDLGRAHFIWAVADPEPPPAPVSLQSDDGGADDGTLGAGDVELAGYLAVSALAADDPLVAAIDAVYHAAIAHGEDRDRFLADAHAALR